MPAHELFLYKIKRPPCGERFILGRPAGIEPTITEPQSVVLPLHHDLHMLQFVQGKPSSAIKKGTLERVAGIGPAASAWKAEVLPLYDTRTSVRRTLLCIPEFSKDFQLAKRKTPTLR